MVYDQTLINFVATGFAFFSSLSCPIHELWGNFFGATLEDRPRYNIVDCFETFPFPPGVLETARGDEAAQAVAATLPEPVRASLDRLEKAGRAYYEFRASLMVKNNEGLTKTYNRFHDPGHDGTGINGRAPADVVADIKKLRALHAEMDRAVLDAYGWGDIPTACEFLLDYEEDEDDDDEGAFRRRQKPWRYRWPDEVRDEVLARLLKLNADRAAEERRKGLTAGPKRPPASSDDDSPPADLDPAPKRGRKKKSSASHATLPGLSPANEDSEP
jgi:hypothetical protein